MYVHKQRHNALSFSLQSDGGGSKFFPNSRWDVKISTHPVYVFLRRTFGNRHVGRSIRERAPSQSGMAEKRSNYDAKTDLDSPENRGSEARQCCFSIKRALNSTCTNAATWMAMPSKKWARKKASLSFAEEALGNFWCNAVSCDFSFMPATAFKIGNNTYWVLFPNAQKIEHNGYMDPFWEIEFLRKVYDTLLKRPPRKACKWLKINGKVRKELLPANSIITRWWETPYQYSKKRKQSCGWRPKQNKLSLHLATHIDTDQISSDKYDRVSYGEGWSIEAIINSTKSIKLRERL